MVVTRVTLMILWAGFQRKNMNPPKPGSFMTVVAGTVGILAIATMLMSIGSRQQTPKTSISPTNSPTRISSASPNSGLNKNSVVPGGTQQTKTAIVE